MSDQQEQLHSSDEEADYDDQQYVYATSPTDVRQARDLKKTRVYGKIKVANLLQIEQDNKISVN